MDTGDKAKSSIPKRTSMWFLNKAVPSGLKKSLSMLNKTVNKGEVEKEALLEMDGVEGWLRDSSSPVNKPNESHETIESPIMSDSITSDVECIVKQENSDSDTSGDEDIDSIVEEFQQKVKVTTAGLKDANLKVPSSSSYRLSILCVTSVITVSVAVGVGFVNDWNILVIPSVIGEF